MKRVSFTPSSSSSSFDDDDNNTGRHSLCFSLFFLSLSYNIKSERLLYDDKLCAQPTKSYGSIWSTMLPHYCLYIVLLLGIITISCCCFHVHRSWWCARQRSSSNKWARKGLLALSITWLQFYQSEGVELIKHARESLSPFGLINTLALALAAFSYAPRRCSGNLNISR